MFVTSQCNIQIESNLHSLTTGRRSVGPSIRRIDTNRFGFLSFFFVCASMTTAVHAVTATTGPNDASSGAELMTHANCKDADDDGRHAPWTYAAIGAIAAMVGQWAFASSDGSDATSFGYGMACGACGVLALQIAAVRRAVLANAEREAEKRAEDDEARREFACEGESDVDGSLRDATRRETEDAASGSKASAAKESASYSGWLTLGEPNPRVKLSSSNGAKRYARLTTDGVLNLSLERGGEVVEKINLKGCSVYLTRFPGVDKPEELRWHKSTPLVLRSDLGREAVRDDGARTVWLFAMSGPAKEAWFVSLLSCCRRLNSPSDGATNAFRAEMEEFTTYTQAVKSYRDESMRRDAKSKGTASSGAGAAGAAINALGSRLLFDMFRDERWQTEQTEKLVNKLNNAPGTPKFVGAFEITHIDFGTTVPQFISARVPSFASSSAPWDGADMPGRGYSQALELDVEYVGKATMTVQTRVDLSKYAQDMENEAASQKKTGSMDDIARSLSSIRSMAAREAAKVVASLSDTLSATPLRFKLTLKKCQGVMRIWIPPPPGDRLWWGLIKEPDIELDIIPELGEAGISHEGIASKVSQFLRNLFVADLHSQLLLPNCVAEPWKELRPYVDAPELTLEQALGNADRSDEEGDDEDAKQARLAPTLSLPTSPVAMSRPDTPTDPASPPPPTDRNIPSFDESLISPTPTPSRVSMEVSPPPSQVMDPPPARSGSAPSSPRNSIGSETTTNAASTPSPSRTQTHRPPIDAPSSEPPPSIKASSGGGFFAQAAARAKALERGFANDFKDFTNAVKDRGVAGGFNHVSKNIEKFARDVGIDDDESESEQDDKRD